MKTYAIIPARGGSKGVPGKNIRLIGGFPLIAYSIVAARLALGIDRVIVSTDSEEIASIAKKYGAEVPFIRPVELSQDQSPDRDFVIHALDWFSAQESGSEPDFLVHLRPTTPFRDPSVISQAVQRFIETPNATSLRSAHPCSESPFKWFLLKENGFFTGIQTDDMDMLNQPRQMFPTVYIPDGYVDVLRVSFVAASDTIHGDKVMGFVSPVCKEVDTLEDFEALEFQLEKQGSPLYRYLIENFVQES